MRNYVETLREIIKASKKESEDDDVFMKDGEEDKSDDKMVFSINSLKASLTKRGFGVRMSRMTPNEEEVQDFDIKNTQNTYSFPFKIKKIGCFSETIAHFFTLVSEENVSEISRILQEGK